MEFICIQMHGLKVTQKKGKHLVSMTIYIMAFYQLSMNSAVSLVLESAQVIQAQSSTMYIDKSHAGWKSARPYKPLGNLKRCRRAAGRSHHMRHLPTPTASLSHK